MAGYLLAVLSKMSPMLKISDIFGPMLKIFDIFSPITGGYCTIFYEHKLVKIPTYLHIYPAARHCIPFV